MRILSYNIHKGIGGRDRRYRLERIVAVIAGESPDVACLQEVDRHARRSGRDDQPALLSAQLGLPHILYQMNHRLKSGGGYGNLILSRHPIRRGHQISIRMGKRKHRGAQLAVIDGPGGPLHVVHAHLGLVEHERRWQVQHILHHHLFGESAGRHPTLLIGDFNDWRNALGHALLHAAGFHQLTAPPRRFRSFPAYLPTIGLDKAFTLGPIGEARARIHRSRVARDASDHLPLVVDIGPPPEDSP